MVRITVWWRRSSADRLITHRMCVIASDRSGKCAHGFTSCLRLQIVRDRGRSMQSGVLMVFQRVFAHRLYVILLDGWIMAWWWYHVAFLFTVGTWSRRIGVICCAHGLSSCFRLQEVGNLADKCRMLCSYLRTRKYVISSDRCRKIHTSCLPCFRPQAVRDLLG